MTQARWNNVWRTFGIVMTVVAVLVGLAMVAVAILFVIAFNSWGSNK